MCRAKGPRCEHTWSGYQRNVYNAKRRVVRNAERLAKAEKNNPDKAEYYRSLMDKAQEEVKENNELLAKEKAERFKTAEQAGQEETTEKAT